MLMTKTSSVLVPKLTPLHPIPHPSPPILLVWKHRGVVCLKEKRLNSSVLSLTVKFKMKNKGETWNQGFGNETETGRNYVMGKACHRGAVL